MSVAEELALALKMSMEMGKTEPEKTEPEMQSTGAAGDVVGGSGTGGGGVQFPNGVPPDVVTNWLDDYLSMLALDGVLDSEYIPRLRAVTLLRHIAEVKLKGDGDDIDIRAAILDEFRFMVGAEGEGDDLSDW